MKRFGFCIVALLLSGLMIGVSNAQQTRPLMYVDIPFDFFVGQKSLPAGNYTVLGDGGCAVIWIRGTQTGAVANTLTIPYREKAPAKSNVLTFHRINDTYFLAKVTVAGSDTAGDLRKTNRERELESIAANRSVTRIAGNPAPAK